MASPRSIIVANHPLLEGLRKTVVFYPMSNITGEIYQIRIGESEIQLELLPVQSFVDPAPTPTFRIQINNGLPLTDKRKYFRALYELITALKEEGRINDESIMSINLRHDQRTNARSWGFNVPEHAIMGAPHIRVGSLLSKIMEKYGRVERLESLAAEQLSPRTRATYNNVISTVKRYGGKSTVKRYGGKSTVKRYGKSTVKRYGGKSTVKRYGKRRKS